MKIAVTSTGEGIDAPVDPHFGRAAHFAIVDTNTMELETVENAGASATGGAGINAAKAAIDAGAEAVLTGNCGPNAERTLRAGGVKLYTGLPGTVAEAVERFKAGTLKEAAGPNVDSHAGMGA